MERIVETTVLLSYQWNVLLKTKQSDAKTFSVSSKKARFQRKRVLQKLVQIYQWNALFKTDLLCPNNGTCC
jgi:hypothetical protein